MFSWWQWAALAAIPPAIVLLYFLKLRRTSVEVPSTYLWHKSIDDLHVNSLWQRLHANLLLVLQLTFIAVLILAALRPGWSASELAGNRFILLIDTSASMSSTDATPTRLDDAKRRASALVEQMADGDMAMVVSFSDSARVEQVFTENRRELARVIGAIQPTNRGTRLDEALRVAAGLANASIVTESDQPQATKELPATIYLFSDGRFPDVQQAAPGNLTTNFVPIGRADAPNVGITALATRPNEDIHDQLQAYARLENFGPQDVTADVELYRDNSLVDNKLVPLKARGSSGVVFDLDDVRSSVIELRIRSGGVLPLDDRAWAAIEPPVPARVLLVTPGNEPLELALGTERASELADVEIARPEILESKDYAIRAAAGHWALVIYDQCSPREMPQADTFFIGRLPPLAAWTAGAKTAAPQIIDIESTHPLLQLIDLGDVKFVEATSLAPPAGSTVLVATDAGPLLAIAPRDSFEDAVLGAEIVGTDDQGQRYIGTDWPLRLSFPVFVLNALTYFGDSASARAESVQPGRSVSFRAAGSNDTISVRTPGGRSVPLVREAGESFRFGATEELGVYSVDEAGQPTRHFAVNLLDAGESYVARRGEIRIGHDRVEGEAVSRGIRAELWKAVLLGALGVVCLEWYIYWRRVYL